VPAYASTGGADQLLNQYVFGWPAIADQGTQQPKTPATVVILAVIGKDMIDPPLSVHFGRAPSIGRNCTN
jgi:hypothetical protein